MEWYRLDISTIVNTLLTDTDNGLSDSDVLQRRKKYGLNILPDVEKRTIFSIFLSQFQSPLIYILFFAALIIFLFGEDKLDAFIISGVLLFNSILGTIQESRTKNIIESLKRFIKTECVTLRNGVKTVVADKDLVAGDVIFLQEGQRIPADARVIESNNLKIDESVLTGESLAVKKIVNTIDHEVTLAEQNNMLFKGTYVIGGAGKAIVVAIGQETEIGKIHKMVEEIKTDIPLRKELDRLSYWILLFIIITCVFLFIMGIFTGKPLKELLVMLTALFVCVVPEGLPVVLMLVLVTGALQMAKRFVLVKNLQAVEALGRTSVIVIDKTGTLTRNEMIVSRVWSDNMSWQITGHGYHSEGTIYNEGVIVKNVENYDALINIAIATILLNNSEVIYLSQFDLFEIKGDPTEAALFVFSQKLYKVIEPLLPLYKKIYEIPFDSTLRYHAGFYQKNNEVIAYIIGSPEVIMQRSVSVPNNVHTVLSHYLEDGLRVVAIGMKVFSKIENTTDEISEYVKFIENEVTFLGFCGIEDSIRPEVGMIIQQSRRAGLRVIMATGDHQQTALHVAKAVNIYQEGDEYSDGPEIEKMSDDQLRKKLPHITVFSRVTASHKMRIVQLLQQLDNIVAMTGDGINDAPSLVQADLGIAMGSIGTEVAKQAADLVLLNDSFANIIDAIEQGRHIFYTLKRVILYFFSTNMGEILIVLFSFLVSLFTGQNFPLPITAVQILWLNLVTDGFLDVGLSMEHKEPGLLKSFWIEKKQQLIDKNLLLKMLFMAIPMAIGSLCVFFYYYKIDLRHAQTMTLITMAMYQWFNAWNCRSMEYSVFKIGLFSNKWLIIATLFVLLLQVCLLYLPFMQHIFKTVPLSFNDWFVVISISAPIVIIEEARKGIMRYWYKKIV